MGAWVAWLGMAGLGILITPGMQAADVDRLLTTPRCPFLPAQQEAPTNRLLRPMLEDGEHEAAVSFMRTALHLAGVPQAE